MPSTISVIIPTYNRYSYLLEALDSVFRQNRPADEIIVVDDGSTDGTPAKLREAQLPVRLITQKNAGPAAARNNGFRAATCDWIALLDSDDVWLPDKLEKQEAFLERFPALDLLFGHMINFGTGHEEAGPEILNASIYDYCRQNASDLRELLDCLLIANPIPTPSVIFRRSSLKTVGYLREDLRSAEDLEWWIRWALLQKCGFLDRVVMKRRIHDSNLIGNRAELLKSELVVFEGLQKRHEILGPTRSSKLQDAINRQRYRLANTYFKDSNYGLAFESLRKTNLLQLSLLERVKCLAKIVISFARK